MSIKSKLIIVFLVMALTPLFFTSLINFSKYRSSLETVRLTQLEDLTIIKSERVEDYFSRLKAEIEMAEHFYNIQKNLPILTYLIDQPKDQEFIYARAMLDGQLSKMQESLDLLSIVLISPQGKVVYTSDAGLRSKYLFRSLPGPGQDAFKNGAKGIYFSDVFLNPIRDNLLQILVTAPVHDFNGAFVGVVAFEVSMASVNRLIEDETGLGQTGETLLGKAVGNEVVFLNPLRHDPEAALNRRVPLGGEMGGPIQEAVLGKTGSGQLLDYRKEQVIAAWRPIPILGWGMVAKIDTAEAFADTRQLRNFLFMIWGIVLILGSAIAYYIANSISGPIKYLAKGAEIVGLGNLDHKLAIDSKDEIGDLSRSFDKMIVDLKDVMSSRDELNKEIAERKQIEAALRISEERWAITLKSIGDGVIATDRNGEITFMNIVSESLTGWTLDEARNVLITDVFNIVNEQTREKVNNPAIKALSTGAPVSLANHTILIKKDKTEVAIDDSGSPIVNRDGQIVGSVLIFRDITERKLSERAKNNFIAILAHELRNPLMPLLLSIQKLEIHTQTEKDSKKTADPIVKESINIAFHQIKNMTRLLDDLLDVSRIERGKIQLKIEKLDLSQVIKHAIVSVTSIMNERNHALSVSLPDEQIIIEADPIRLEQIFTNLLNNSAKYTNQGGHISLSMQRKKDLVEIVIKDDGIGINEDKLLHIFEPFYQTEMALNRSHGGLGLGLMLVKNLLKIHKGAVEVKSQGEGKGSEFIVSLPISKTGSSLPVSKNKVFSIRTVHSSSDKKKILIIDDNRTIASLMADLLGGFGYEVATAYEGNSAIILAGKINPHFILCDIGLPGMNGYEVARKIRQMEKGDKKIIMIAVTGFGQEEDRKNAYEAGFDHHLVKPVSVEDLKTIIDSYNSKE